MDRPRLVDVIPRRSSRRKLPRQGHHAELDSNRSFAPYDRDLLAYALRPLKWFHRRVMLHHGLLIARAPLTPMERRLVSLLLTERVEKEIAYELALTLATTHTYISGLFRKFGVSGRSGLTALWLGKPPA
jgi:DNA-binding CsgD family transcriptional regulator